MKNAFPEKTACEIFRRPFCLSATINAGRKANEVLSSVLNTAYCIAIIFLKISVSAGAEEKAANARFIRQAFSNSGNPWSRQDSSGRRPATLPIISIFKERCMNALLFVLPSPLPTTPSLSQTGCVFDEPITAQANCLYPFNPHALLLV